MLVHLVAFTARSFLVDDTPFSLKSFKRHWTVFVRFT